MTARFLLLVLAAAAGAAHAADGATARARSARLAAGWHEGQLATDADGCRRFHPARAGEAVPVHALTHLQQRNLPRAGFRSLTSRLLETMRMQRRDGWMAVSLGPLVAAEPVRCRIEDGQG